MILRELVLHNFGAYRGRHTIALNPPNRDRPIVLIGALNGSGKTTILDALRLALYGPRAQLVGRAGYAYDEYLRRATHRSVPASDGASVEVEYSTQLDGEAVVLRVRRSWSERGKGIREDLDILRDGQLDRVLTDSWSDYIQEFFPLEISELFFFDGEKVADLADPHRSSALMRTAVHSLLGVNLIDQLDTDLSVLQRRKRSLLRTTEEASKIDDLRSKAEATELEHEAAVSLLAEARTALERLHVQLERVNAEYRKKGGEAYEHRSMTEAEHESATRRRSEEYQALRDLAAGDAPLLLLADQLEVLHHRSERERSVDLNTAVNEELEERDRSIVEFTTARDEVVAAALEAYLEADRRHRHIEAPARQTTQLSGETESTLLHLVTGGGLQALREQLAAALARTEAAEASVNDTDRKLASIPDPASVESILRIRRDLLEKIQEATVKRDVAAELASRTELDLERRRAAYAAGLDRQIEREFADESATRVIDHAGRVRTLLGGFRTAVVAEHLERIEQSVLEAFQVLVRKDTLARGLRLDPDTMDLELTDDRGRAIPTDQLSAGERQLMAVAMLWGLARVSGKRLPTVIDTPLARLDGVHRDHISNRYFPVASHQVIILSTDEELDARLFEQLEPHIGRSYTLEYDDVTHGTSVLEGYRFIPESSNAG